MTYLSYDLAPGGYVNRFLTAGVYTQASPYGKTVLQGRVNEWLIKGWSVYDNPCRKEVAAALRGLAPDFVNLAAALPGSEITQWGQTKQAQVYFPFDSAEMIHAAFYETPSILRWYAGCTLMAPTAEKAAFHLAVSGGVTLWLNGEMILDFKPFLRNEAAEKQIFLPLVSGKNELVCCLEDVAERDTEMRLKLRYRGVQSLRQCVPVEDGTNAQLVFAAEHALSNMAFPKEAYFREVVALHLEAFASMPVDMLIQPERAVAPIRTQLFPGQREVKLFHAKDAPSGYYYFQVTLNVERLAISKRIGTYAHDGNWLDCGAETYAERKKIVREIIKHSAENPDYRALVLMDEGEEPEQFETVFLNHLGWVEQMRDCSDFRMMLLVYLYVRYANRLSDGFRQRLEEAILHYRYWIDEPGADVMWFFSENHALMFHTCQYLAGKAMPDRIFTASNLTGKEASHKAENLLRQWFTAFFAESVTEWNSSTYIPIDVMALGYLHLLTPEGEAIHDDARRALDMLCYTMALYEHRGAMMSSFGRTYEKELKGSLSTGMTSLLYLFYNAGPMNNHTRALVPFLIGSYTPPEEYGRYTRLRGKQKLLYQNTQGMGQFVNLYLYKNANVLLSTAVCFHPFQKGYQENIVQAVIDATAQVFVNHPGEAEVYGLGRPGFWAGNGSLPRAFQYETLSVIQYHIPRECAIGYTHAYAPLSEFTRWQMGKNALALEKNGAYIGLWAMNGIAVQNQGPCRNREMISAGRDNVWLLRVATAEEFHTLEALLEAMEGTSICRKDENHFTITHMDKTYAIHGNSLQLDGRPVHHYPLNIRGMVEEEGL